MTLRALLVGTFLASIVVAVSAPPAAAQRRVRSRPQSRHRVSRAEAVRAEYAGVLLQRQRYDEAVTEYRTLVATDTTNRGYQLGLARALAWGGHPGDAEPLVARLASLAPSDTSVSRFLIEVRLAMRPGASTALRWHRESPGNRDYMLAFARALLREHRDREALAAFDSLLDARATVALLREAAGAHAAARDSVGNARLLGRAFRLAGFDPALQRQYADALDWSGDRRGAIAQYTDLLRHSPNDPELLLARGRLEVWNGDYDEGVRDLRASLARRPSAAAYALLGDAYRWRGDARHSRQAYAAALAMAPGDSTAQAGLAALDQLRAGVLASRNADDPGWSATFTHVEDNAGFLYLAGGIGRVVAISRSTTVGIDAEQRRISERFPRAAERYVYGIAIGGSAAHQFDALTAGAHAGVVRHGAVGNTFFGDVHLTRGWRAANFGATLSTGPAYLPLVSVQSLVQFDTAGIISAHPLLARTAQVSGSAPLGALTLSGSAELTALSDGNRRTSGYLGAAYPIAPELSLLYSGFALGYHGRSDRYWDPTLYGSQSVGAQYAPRARGPFTLSARALAGIGRATEIFGSAGGAPVRATGRAAFQLSTSGDLTYRRAPWDVAITVGYSRGREGEYQSLNSGLRVRLMP
jgi:Flp pilus assembly protein TadD